jgi:chromosomal replication initiation ATPase DnaA
MTDQLYLNIKERITYSADNYICHAGVEDVIAAFESSLVDDGFSILYVTGTRRTGKTHTAITCSDRAIKAGFLPHMLEGTSAASWLAADNASSRSVVIIDDADQYLNKVLPGQSGIFVNCIERHRILGSTIVLFSQLEHTELPCDEHVISRLIPGIGFTLGAPPEDSVKDLLKVLARQRGMQLSEKKLLFAARRLARDIRSLEDYLDRVYQLSRTLGKTAQFPLLSDAI